MRFDPSVSKTLASALALLLSITVSVFATEKDSFQLKAKSILVLPLELGNEGWGAAKGEAKSEDLPSQQRYTEIQALMLERAGAKSSVSGAQFELTDPVGENRIPQRIGDFIEENQVASDYCLYVKLDSKDQLDGISIWLVGRDGKVRFHRKETEFPNGRPRHPLAALIFTTGMLGAVSDLDDPMRADAPGGPMADLMSERSGTPKQPVLKAMKRRWATSRERLRDASLGVFPIIAWKDGVTVKSGDGEVFAKAMKNHGFTKAIGINDEIAQGIEGDPKSSQTRWELAKGFREQVSKGDEEVDYVVLVAMDSLSKVGSLQVIICNGDTGDWLLVDVISPRDPAMKDVKSGSVPSYARAFSAWLSRQVDSFPLSR